MLKVFLHYLCLCTFYDVMATVKETEMWLPRGPRTLFANVKHNMQRYTIRISQLLYTTMATNFISFQKQ